MSQIEWDSSLLWEEYQNDVVKECIKQIGAKIFNQDHTGSNAYIYLRRQIRELKVNLYVGSRKYEERLNNFQKYLPFCSWVFGVRMLIII